MLSVSQDRAILREDDQGPVFRIRPLQGIFGQQARSYVGQPAVEVHLEETGTVSQVFFENFGDEGGAAGFKRDGLSIQRQALRRKGQALHHFVAGFCRKGRGGGRLGVDHRAVAAAEPGLQLDECPFVRMFNLAADFDPAAHAQLFESVCRKNEALVQRAHHNDGLHDPGGAESMPVVGLDGGREELSQSRVLDRLGFHLVVEHSGRTVRRDAGQLGFYLRGQDLLDGAAHAVPTWNRRADVVGIVVEAAVEDIPGAGVPVQVAGEDDRGGTLSDVEAQALDVKGSAGCRRQGFQRFEAGQDESREDIDAANHRRIVIARSDQPVGQHLRRGSGNAGVAHGNGIVDKAQMGCHLLHGHAGCEIASVFFRNISQFVNPGRGGAQNENQARGRRINRTAGQCILHGMKHQRFKPAETVHLQGGFLCIREDAHAEMPRNAQAAIHLFQACFAAPDGRVVFLRGQAQRRSDIG